jgi:hypothetical protein
MFFWLAFASHSSFSSVSRVLPVVQIKSKLFVEFNVSVAGLAGDLSTLSGEIVAAAEVRALTPTSHPCRRCGACNHAAPVITRRMA